MCTSGAYIAAGVCVCRSDNCVCKGVQGSVRVYVQGGADIATRGCVCACMWVWI